jgi:hypothetical protein
MWGEKLATFILNFWHDVCKTFVGGGFLGKHKKTFHYFTSFKKVHFKPKIISQV